MWCVVFRMVCVLVSEFPNSTGRWVFQWKLLSSSWEELSSRTAGWPCNTVQGGCNFWVCGWNPKVWLFKWKLYWAELSSRTAGLPCSIRWFWLLSLWIKSKKWAWLFKWKLPSRTFQSYCCLPCSTRWF